jgi:hypothetical protein
MEQDGIWPPFEALYIESMLWHTKSAFYSISAIRDWLDAIRNHGLGRINTNESDLFNELQNILHQAGCVSRYFFPTGRAAKPLHTRRAEKLRESFNIKEDNPLSDRDLRNAIEHFDERLDQYLAENQIGNFFPTFIDYNIQQSDIPTHIFKGFYINPIIFSLLGKSYEMNPLIEEMLRVHNLLEQCLENGSRLPSSVTD